MHCNVATIGCPPLNRSFILLSRQRVSSGNYVDWSAGMRMDPSTRTFNALMASSALLKGILRLFSTQATPLQIACAKHLIETSRLGDPCFGFHVNLSGSSHISSLGMADFLQEKSGCVLLGVLLEVSKRSQRGGDVGFTRKAPPAFACCPWLQGCRGNPPKGWDPPRASKDPWAEVLPHHVVVPRHPADTGHAAASSQGLQTRPASGLGLG